MFRRRSRCPAAPAPASAPADVTVIRVTVDDHAGVPARTREPVELQWAALRRVVAEILIRQDEAEALLNSFRQRPDLSEVAAPCGRLRGRFVELREALPESQDPEIERHVRALRQILDHHV